jgi:hypothetical protein
LTKLHTFAMADDEYEYQYDTNESTTFLVELDLSTLNGIKREVPKRQYNKRGKKTAAGVNEDDEDLDGNDEDVDRDQDVPTTAESGPAKAKGMVQILESDSLNPMVAYKGNFYSCTWHDMIGTHMFYSLPHQDIAHVPLRSNQDYNLLGTSRVKLVGHRAKVTERPSARKKQRLTTEIASRSKLHDSSFTSSDNGQSHTEAGPANVDADIQEQTDFMEKLKAIQKSREATSNGTSHVERLPASDGPGMAASDQHQNRIFEEKAVS